MPTSYDLSKKPKKEERKERPKLRKVILELMTRYDCQTVKQLLDLESTMLVGVLRTQAVRMLREEIPEHLHYATLSYGDKVVKQMKKRAKELEKLEARYR